MEFKLLKTGRNKYNEAFYEYGYSKEDHSQACKNWEQACHTHIIKHARRAFPPSPPNLDLFIPRINAIQRDQAEISHRSEGYIKTNVKSNGNIQIIVKKPKFEETKEEQTAKSFKLKPIED